MDLERGQISKNPGPKTTTKLMLNSFWGKFRESLNKTKVSQMTEAFELLSIIASPPERCTGIQIISVDMIEVISRRREVIKPPLKTRTRVDALTSMRLPSRPGRHA